MHIPTWLICVYIAIFLINYIVAMNGIKNAYLKGLEDGKKEIKKG